MLGKGSQEPTQAVDARRCCLALFLFCHRGYHQDHTDIINVPTIKICRRPSSMSCSPPNTETQTLSDGAGEAMHPGLSQANTAGLCQMHLFGISAHTHMRENQQLARSSTKAFSLSFHPFSLQLCSRVLTATPGNRLDHPKYHGEVDMAAGGSWVSRMPPISEPEMVLPQREARSPPAVRPPRSTDALDTECVPRGRGFWRRNGGLSVSDDPSVFVGPFDSSI